MTAHPVTPTDPARAVTVQVNITDDVVLLFGADEGEDVVHILLSNVELVFTLPALELLHNAMHDVCEFDEEVQT